jgi:hypothetical protein
MPIPVRKNRSLALTKAGFFDSKTAEDYRLALIQEETIMFYALSWLVVFSLLALWSLAAWAFHSAAAWTVANAAVLASGSGAIEALRVPDWLAPWIPSELAAALTSMLSAFTPAIEALLGWAPALASGLSVAVWVVWGVGSALLIALGLVLSGMIAVLGRRASGRTSASVAAETPRSI